MYIPLGLVIAILIYFFLFTQSGMYIIQLVIILPFMAIGKVFSVIYEYLSDLYQSDQLAEKLAEKTNAIPHEERFTWSVKERIGVGILILTVLALSIVVGIFVEG